MTSTETTTDATVERNRWRAFAVAIMVASITIMDLTKVNVALPSIEQAFDAASTQLQLVVSGYVLAFGLVLVPMGRLGDQRSRRTLFLIGLGLFTVTSAAGALAPTVETLLVARLLQGVAAGIQMPQVIGLVQELFRGPERGRAFGIFGAAIGISTAFGPTLGGLLIAVGGAQDGWRLIWWMNVPLGIAAMLLAWRLLPRRRSADRRPVRLDPVGVVLLGLCVLALMTPFLLTTGAPTDDPRRWWVLVAFAVLLAVLLWWERRYAASGRDPIISLALLRIGSFRNGTALATVYFAAMPAMFLLTTLYLQDGLGLEPVYAGMVTITFALASALTSWWGGTMVNRIGRPLVVAGIAVMIAGVVMLGLSAHLLTAEAVPWVMAGVMLLAGLGGGVVIAPNQTLALADVPVERGGLAGSMGQLGQRIGTAIGTAVALSLFYATVYAAQEREGAEITYRDAYEHGLYAVAALLVIALLVGLLDLRQRVRA